VTAVGQTLELVLLVVAVPLVFATLAVRLLPARATGTAKATVFVVCALLCAGAMLVVGVAYGFLQP
jgi:hypothetical protein